MARVSAAPSGPSASRRRRYSSSVSAPPLSARASSPAGAGFRERRGGAVAAASAAASSARLRRSVAVAAAWSKTRGETCVVFPAGAATGWPRAGGGADGDGARAPHGTREESDSAKARCCRAIHRAYSEARRGVTTRAVA